MHEAADYESYDDNSSAQPEEGDGIKSSEGPATSTLVVIPTFNEAANIGEVLRQVIALPEGLSVLVVDDGSPDGTAQIVSSVKARFPERVFLFEREKKLGLGTAYLAGYQFALEKGFDIVCEMDADLSHNPSDLPILIQPIVDGSADLVIGSRYVDGVRVMNWPLSRLMLSYGAGIYTRVITRLPVYDVTAGFKAIHSRVLKSIALQDIHSNGYSFQIEVKYRAWKKGFRLLEVPIVFTERTEGQSKMSKAIVREAALKVWELRFRTIFGKL